MSMTDAFGTSIPTSITVVETRTWIAPSLNRRMIASLRMTDFSSEMESDIVFRAIVVPVNTIFGVVCGLAIVRRRFPGKGLLNAFVDLPLALSPVVVGLSLFLLYGRGGWFVEGVDGDPSSVIGIPCLKPIHSSV